MDACKECRFFERQKILSDDAGLCRRHAPRARVIYNREADPVSNSDCFADWPLVFDTDWCGEWAARDWATMQADAARDAVPN